MSNQNLTLIAFLLDRSGSMQSIKSDVVGCFDAFLTDQRAGDGECRVTRAQFDNEYEVDYHAVPVADVPALELNPRGVTALLDSMGKLITDTAAEIAALVEDDRPGSVIVAIMTDGLENASHEWSRPAIKSLVEQQTNQWVGSSSTWEPTRTPSRSAWISGQGGASRHLWPGSPGRRWPRCRGTCRGTARQDGGHGRGYASVQ